MVVPGGPAPIEGLFHRGARRPPLLIAPPHPGAGSMESPIVAELAWAATRAGHPTLRLNYPGVGASGGAFSSEAALDATRLAAEHLALTTGAEAVALAGLGFGAEVVVQLAAERVRAGLGPPLVVLVAPQVGIDLAGLRGAGVELLFVVAEGDDAARREALRGRAAELRDGRLAVIPGADPAFVRGLVELGRVVAEALAPPGLIDLE